jgi:peptidoglycan hydrolase CwlO-like protein
MFKKVLIATVAVVFGLALIKGTWLWSHARQKYNGVCAWVKDQVPLEQEIKRLRQELTDLAQQDSRFYDSVARLSVDVDTKEAEVQKLRTTVQRKEAQIRKIKNELRDGIESVSYNGSRVTRSDLRGMAISFKNAEESLKIKEASLEAKKGLLAVERKKLAELKNTREAMATELDRLEADLAREREIQAASKSTIDDSGYKRQQKSIEALRYRLNVIKKNRELRGEFPPAEENKASETDAQADKYLETRFGQSKEVVSEK